MPLTQSKSRSNKRSLASTSNRPSNSQAIHDDAPVTNNENMPPIDQSSLTSSPNFMASTKASRNANLTPVSKLPVPRRIGAPSSPFAEPKPSWMNNAVRKLRRPSAGGKGKDEVSVPLPARPAGRPSMINRDGVGSRIARRPTFAVNKPLPHEPSRKPLPSPPAAVVSSGRSPPKPVRTLIDAFDQPLRRSPGTPNEHEWPALDPAPAQQIATASDSSAKDTQKPGVEMSDTASKICNEEKANNAVDEYFATRKEYSVPESAQGSKVQSGKDVASAKTDSLGQEVPPIPPRQLRHRYNFSRTRMTDNSKPESNGILTRTNGITNLHDHASASGLSGLSSLSQGPTSPHSDISEIDGTPGPLPSLQKGSFRRGSTASLRKSSSASFRSQLPTPTPGQPRLRSSDQSLRNEPGHVNMKKTRSSFGRDKTVSDHSTAPQQEGQSNIRRSISHEPISLRSSSAFSKSSNKRLNRLSSCSSMNGLGPTLTISGEADTIILGQDLNSSTNAQVPPIPEFLKQSRINSEIIVNTESSAPTGHVPDDSFPGQTVELQGVDESLHRGDIVPETLGYPFVPEEHRKRTKPVVFSPMNPTTGTFTHAPPYPVAFLENVRHHARANALSQLEGRSSSPSGERSSSSYPSARSTSPHANLLLGKTGNSSHQELNKTVRSGSQQSSRTPLAAQDDVFSKSSQSTVPTSFTMTESMRDRSLPPHPALAAPVASTESGMNSSNYIDEGTVRRRSPTRKAPQANPPENRWGGISPEELEHIHFVPPRYPSNGTAYSNDIPENVRNSRIYNIPLMASTTHLRNRDSGVSKSPSRTIRSKMSKVRNLFHRGDKKNNLKSSLGLSKVPTQTSDRRVMVSSTGSPLQTAKGTPSIDIVRGRPRNSRQYTPSPAQILARVPQSLRESHDPSSPAGIILTVVEKIVLSIRNNPDHVEQSTSLSIAQAMTEAVQCSRNARLCLQKAEDAAKEARLHYEHSETTLKHITDLVEVSGGPSNFMKMASRSKKSRH